MEWQLFSLTAVSTTHHEIATLFSQTCGLLKDHLQVLSCSALLTLQTPVYFNKRELLQYVSSHLISKNRLMHPHCTVALVQICAEILALVPAELLL